MWIRTLRRWAMTVSSYDEALQAVAAGDHTVTPGMLMDLWRAREVEVEAEQAARAVRSDLAKTRKAAEQARAEREQRAREAIAPLREQLAEQRARVTEADKACAAAYRARTEAWGKLAELHRGIVCVAQECYPEGVPRDDDGHPVAAVYLDWRTPVVDGVRVEMMEDSPAEG